MPEGQEVIEKSFSSSTELQTHIIREINKLIQEGNITPDQIIILLNTEKENSSLANTRRIGSFPLQKLKDNGVLSENAIHYSHINFYKGLEADIVFVVDIQKAANNPKLLYTQASRAKHLLYLYDC